MLDDVLRYLACPYCGASMARDGGSLRCGAGHSFDVARQGYASLLPAGAGGRGGDTAGMVRARGDFLAAGHFASLAAEIARVASAAAAGTAGCVVDIGAGTGYYLAAVLDRLPGRAGVALDRSKHALRRAARAHRSIGAVACDAWHALPVADSAASLALNVFAPRDAAELHRILSPTGRLIVVTPTPAHLRELVAPLGLLTVGSRKEQRLGEKLSPYFRVAGRHEHRATMRLDHWAVEAVAAMGPSAWHTEPAELAARAARLPDLMPVTLAVTLTVLRPSARALPPRQPLARA